MNLRSSAGATLLGAVVVPAAPALAQAPPAALATSQPCYITGAPMAVAGTGFSPGAQWRIKSEQLFESGQVDPAGALTAAPPRAPSLGTVRPLSRQFDLIGTEVVPGGVEVERARTTFRVANFAAAVSPTRGRPQSPGNWRFSGFTPNRSVYVHVRRSGTTLGSFRFGVARGACGELRRRAKRLPISDSRIRSGTYQLAFDSARRFSPATRPQVRYSTSVFLTRR